MAPKVDILGLMESIKDSAIPCPMTHLKDFLMPSQTFLVSAVKIGNL